MKKLTLGFEPDFDFRLIAVVSPLRGYKLCWSLEQNLNLRLHRTEDLALHSKREKQTMYFQVFQSEEQEEIQEYFTLIGNKSSNGFLIAEQKVVDFYLKIEDSPSESEFRKLADAISKLKDVQHSFIVEPNNLKSKQNLIL